MAPINISAITFIPGMEFTFGSFNFITGIDGRLHVFDPETTRTGQIGSDSASRTLIQPVSKSNSARPGSGSVQPRYQFGFCNSANTFQRMNSQIMETQFETDSGEQGRAVNIIRPTYNECRAVNIIMPPLEHCDLGEGSLHHILNSPTHSDSSDGSWDPVRELYAITGGGEVPIEAQLKAQEDEAIRLQAVEIAAAEAERL